MNAPVESRPSILGCPICDARQVVDVFADGQSRHRCLADRSHTDWRYSS